jgi:hypothetical protein
MTLCTKNIVKKRKKMFTSLYHFLCLNKIINSIKYFLQTLCIIATKVFFEICFKTGFKKLFNNVDV